MTGWASKGRIVLDESGQMVGAMDNPFLASMVVDALNRAGRREAPPQMTPGTAMVAAERLRQITEEGYTPEHDSKHARGVLAWAAWCLLDRADHAHPTEQAPPIWPLPRDQWPGVKSSIKLLRIAAALVIAEIDWRLDHGEMP